MLAELRTAYQRDPALHGISAAEAVLYPGVWALVTHRVASRMYRNGIPFLPRLLSQTSRLLTGIEIHPGARIGQRCFIDHGAGVVIGETTEIGDDVSIFQGVTLGARGFWTDLKGAKRHPTIGDSVTLSVGATVLGPVTIGSSSRIGAHALVVADVPPDTTVSAPPSHMRGRRLNSRQPLDYQI
ncbi:MAG: serine O-acetyltransferase EpsC [Frankiaceae bacterium]|jgi:serine O-acetyltransferase